MMKQTKYIAVLIPILGVLVTSKVILIKVLNTNGGIELWRIIFALVGFLLTCLLSFLFIRKGY